MKQCQQSQVYEAEAVLQEGRRFGSISEVQSFVDELRETDWWEREYEGLFRIEVYGRPEAGWSVGSWNAEMNAGKIELTPAGMTLRTVVHEVSHVLAGFRYGSGSHDPWYARTMLEAVYRLMGSDAYRTLYHEYRLHDVQVHNDEPITGRIAL